jgi:hypothetical protein
MLLGLLSSLWETFIFEFVFILFFSIVSDSGFNSAFTTSAFFGWLLLIPSGGIDRLVLLCTSLTYKTALYSPLKELSHLFVPFLTFCIYFSTILVCSGSIIGEPTPFSFIRLVTSSSFWIRSGKDPPCNIFLKLIRRRPKKKKSPILQNKQDSTLSQ